MIVGITGDTHHSEQSIRRVLAAAPAVDVWLHTGDCVEDADVLGNLSGRRVIRVTGNCDIGNRQAPPDQELTLEGFKLWLTHGHKYIDFNDRREMAWWAEQLKVDIVVYGHLHVPRNEWINNKLLINPGSPSRPRTLEGPSFAVLTLKAGEKPEVQHIFIE